MDDGILLTMKLITLLANEQSKYDVSHKAKLLIPPIDLKK